MCVSWSLFWNQSIWPVARSLKQISTELDSVMVLWAPVVHLLQDYYLLMKLYLQCHECLAAGLKQVAKSLARWEDGPNINPSTWAIWLDQYYGWSFLLNQVFLLWQAIPVLHSYRFYRRVWNKLPALSIKYYTSQSVALWKWILAYYLGLSKSFPHHVATP